MLLSSHCSRRLGGGLKVPSAWVEDLPEGAEVFVINGKRSLDILLESGFRQRRRNKLVAAGKVEGGMIQIPPSWLAGHGLACAVLVLEGHVDWLRVISIARFRRQISTAKARRQARRG